MSGILKYKKAIIIGVIILAVLWVLSQSWFYEILFGFLLAGVLPGTSIILPTWIMLILIVAAALILVRWLVKPTHQPALSKSVTTTRYHKPVKTTVTGAKRSKKAVAKKRQVRRPARAHTS